MTPQPRRAPQPRRSPRPRRVAPRDAASVVCVACRRRWTLAFAPVPHGLHITMRDPVPYEPPVEACCILLADAARDAVLRRPTARA